VLGGRPCPVPLTAVHLNPIKGRLQNMLTHGTRGAYNQGCRCEVCAAANRAHVHEWKRANPRALADQKRRYREAHREKTAEYQRRWREDNPVNHAANDARYRARKSGVGGTYSAKDVQEQLGRQRRRCFWCGEPVPKRGYHVDHVVPLALGGSNAPENLVIACSTCNHRKHSKHPMEFAGMLC